MSTFSAKGTPVAFHQILDADGQGEPVFALVRTSRDGINPRRRRWVRALGAVAIAGTLIGSVSMVLSNDSARNEVISWLSIGHAARVQQGIRSVQSLLKTSNDAQ